ncbi:MAG: serine/threonine protein kinase [Myxococcales bacterium]|nr:MAG: serine/threonine protein kinase [Myxococcales bacterium]
MLTLSSGCRPSSASRCPITCPVTSSRRMWERVGAPPSCAEERATRFAAGCCLPARAVTRSSVASMTTPSPRRFPRLVETVGEDSPVDADAAAAAELHDSSHYLAGEVVGDRYRLVREIGRGGMGVVWVAHSLVLGVDVALKLIRASAASSALSSRMAREAHAAARLGHPALVRVFDFGWTRHGDPYLVMELVQGETLAALVRREARVPAIRAVQTLLPIVDGLRLAHDKGIVHRDIKPDNVFLAADALGRRQPKLLDFGIAKVDKQVDGRLTQIGAVLGSPDYMSPEQALGLDDIDERTDIWSLCVVLYEVITGKVPFQKPNYNALMHAIINEDPTPSIECGAGDKALWQIIQRGLHKQREDRFQTVTDLGEAMALWLYEHGIKEDLSGNSIRAVWLDTTLSMNGGELRSGRSANHESVSGPRAGLRSPGNVHSGNAETLHTLAPRDTSRRARALFLALPVGALLVGAAGTWLALRPTAPAASAELPRPRASLATPAALGEVAPPPLAPSPSAIVALPEQSVRSTPAAPKPRPRAVTAVRKKGHDFGF